MTHIVTNSNGCKDTQNFIIYIGSNPSISMPNPGSTTGQCLPKFYSFTIAGFASNSPGTTYKIESNDKGIDTIFQHPPPSFFNKTYNNHSCGYTSPNPYPNSYYLKITASNSCGSSTQTIEPIQISTKPKANFSISPDTIVCINNDLTFTNTSINGKYINPSSPTLCDSSNLKEWAISPNTGWTVVSGVMTGFSTNAITINFQTVGIFQIKFVLYNNSSPCGTDTIIKTICVHPQSIPNFTFTQSPLCKNSTVQIANLSNTLTSCGTTKYSWSVLDSATNVVVSKGTKYSFVAPTDTNSINPKLLFTQAGKYKIRLTLTNRCGTSIKDTFLTVKDIPTVSFASQSFCDSQTVTFIPTYQPNYGTISSYNWIITPVGSTFVSGNSGSANPTIFFPLNITTAPITYTVKATATNECGISPVETQTVTLYPRPTISNAGPTKILCNATATTMAANTPIVGIGSWAKVSGPAGDSIVGPSNPSASIIGLNSTGNPSIYVYKWTISQISCTPSVSYDTIKVYPPSNSGTLASSATVCSGINSGNLVLSGNIGAVVNWEYSVAPFSTWTNIANTTTTLNYSNLTQTTQYRVAVQNGSSCAVVKSPFVTITVDSPSIGGLLSNFDTVCISGNSGNIAVNNKKGNIIKWQKNVSNPVNSSSWVDIASTANPLPYSGLTQSTWYRVIIQNGVCGAVTSDSVRIVVDSIPSNADAPDRFACAASLIGGINDSLIANNILIGKGNWTYISGPNTPTINSPNQNISTISNLNAGIHLIEWKVSNGKCPASRDTLKFTVYPLIQSTISSNQTICNGQSPALFTSTVPTGGNNIYNYQWQQSNDSITLLIF
ncbi:MAG: hypothetical protein IPK03_06150 [Bacteroidetes bacterium]|nr:hypothetical protein [Bacteroidota bacterium]